MKNTKNENSTFINLLKIVIAVGTALLSILGGAEAYTYLTH